MASHLRTLAAVSLVTLVACEKGSFKGGDSKDSVEKRTQKPTNPSGKDGAKVPGEVDANDRTKEGGPTGEPIDPQRPVATVVPPVVTTTNPCVPTSTRKAARIAFVVDNSGSHGRNDGAVPAPSETWYTDPVTPGATPFQKSGVSTVRQKALFDLVVEIARLDDAARAKDASFPGTDVGLASFPASLRAQDEFAIHSGRDALPNAMTNLASAPFDDARQRLLWDTLAFTHTPEGMTPYQVGLQSAAALLRAGRTASDTREEHVILLSDGLPTDERPSLVLEAREALGRVKVHLVNVRKDAATQANAQRTSYEGLKDRFLMQPITEAWAVKPGNNGGFPQTEAGYEHYWKDLSSLPERIADEQTTSDTAALKQSLTGILGSIQGCR